MDSSPHHHHHHHHGPGPGPSHSVSVIFPVLHASRTAGELLACVETADHCLRAELAQYESLLESSADAPLALKEQMRVIVSIESYLDECYRWLDRTGLRTLYEFRDWEMSFPFMAPDAGSLGSDHLNPAES